MYTRSARAFLVKRFTALPAKYVAQPRANIAEGFGNHPFGQSCLLAARLVEAGVRFVTVGIGGWDTHVQNFKGLRSRMLPQLDDGLSALLTTAPRQQNGDTLFTQFKQQNYVELGHHQWKTPLAVRPVFLKSPRRVEALVCLMQVALTAYQLLERFYRQSLEANAGSSERHRTTESLLRLFRGYGLIDRRTHLGRVVHATRLTVEQARVLRQLGFPTPAQLLAQILAPLPLG